MMTFIFSFLRFSIAIFFLLFSFYYALHATYIHIHLFILYYIFYIYVDLHMYWIYIYITEQPPLSFGAGPAGCNAVLHPVTTDHGMNGIVRTTNF